MATKLQDHIDALHSLPLAEAIRAIADLMPGLTSVPPPEAGYFVQHPDYEGIGNLNNIGGLWLRLGSQCHDDHAPLDVRLVHQSLDRPIYDIYCSSDEMLGKALDEKTVSYPVPNEDAGCACCRGEPSATILCNFHEREALYFTPEEYTELWGDQPNHGSRHSGWKEGEGYTEHRICASREQVEEALARTSGDGVGVQRMT
ncbi:uncharacterized protein N7515_001342 [Penicillium bovifimosum]|uniref:Uncharacterized protein n=1 Tax=Penicillium bovifimosum TaxID=126998 RepID=A0A9W9HA08_9EURO|nr:uncharacterized protein N7515_001342 [Penicillium bovifimosum]KAJ5142555.1 hypothetical protein N7515_001342 [Penicillium bovifimosum]